MDGGKSSQNLSGGHIILAAGQVCEKNTESGIDEKNYEKMPHMCVENSRNPNFTVFL